MAKKSVKAKNKANFSKWLRNKKNFKLIFIFCTSIAVVLLFFLILFLTRPKLVWYVDENISADWNRILRESPPPYSRYEIISRPANDPFPQGRFGFFISRNCPEGERIDDVPVVMYPGLSRTREYKDWYVLAVDPWMIFRKHRDPEPQISFLENTNQRGTLLLAGNDRASRQAWLCQLLQRRPGSFAAGSGLWEDKEQSLVNDYPFQSGAFSYSWIQVWPLVFRSDTAYLYAPLSQARRQRPEQMGLLGASRFPDSSNWGSYGLQADILWAGIQGYEKEQEEPSFFMKLLAAIGFHTKGKQQEILEDVLKWLQNPLTQTSIANTFQWIPAHPSGFPYNSISSDSHIAWLRSSYIWQGVYDAQDQ